MKNNIKNILRKSKGISPTNNLKRSNYLSLKSRNCS